MRIILVTGMPGSGKEEFLGVARGMGLPFIRMGDLVRDHYTRRDPDAESLSLGQYADRERKLHGTGIWAERAVSSIKGDIFLIDGCRSNDEAEMYRGLGKVIVVAIHANPSIRYDRLVKRGRDDAPKDIFEFKTRDSRELSWGIGDLIALSDRLIINECSLDEFKKKATEVLRDL